MVDMKAVKDAYATYGVMPELSYKIIEHLMTNPEAEIIWKLLKYNDAEAWSKPNLTKKEKAAMMIKTKKRIMIRSILLLLKILMR